MTWLARSRSWARLALGWVASVIFVIAATGIAAPFPELLNYTGMAVPAVVASPILPACIILAGTISALPHLEAAASRPVMRVDLLVTAAATLASCGVFSIAGMVSNNPALEVSLRNLIGLVGIGLLARLGLSRAASVSAPLLFLIMTMVFGNRETGRTWDWLLAPRDSSTAWVILSVFSSAGSGPPRPPGRPGSTSTAPRRTLRWRTSAASSVSAALPPTRRATRISVVPRSMAWK